MSKELNEDLQSEWRDRIMSINDGKLLDYICSLCDARRTLGRADEDYKDKPKEDKNSPAVPAYYGTPDKMTPIWESEDPDENA